MKPVWSAQLKIAWNLFIQAEILILDCLYTLKMYDIKPQARGKELLILGGGSIMLMS